MNDLEVVTSKIVSAREIIDTAAEAIQKHDYDKAETLAMAAYEFLGYYLDEFDAKFKLAWQETVVKQKEEDPCMPPWGHSDLEYLIKHKEPVSCDKDDPSPECKGSWNSFWEEENITKADGYSVNTKNHSEYYYDYTRNDPNRKNPFLSYNEAVTDGWTMTDDGFWIKENTKKWVLPVEEAEDVDTNETEYFISLPQDLLEATKLKEGDEINWVDNGDGSFKIVKVTKSLGPDEC